MMTPSLCLLLEACFPSPSASHSEGPLHQEPLLPSSETAAGICSSLQADRSPQRFLPETLSLRPHFSLKQSTSPCWGIPAPGNTMCHLRALASVGLVKLMKCARTRGLCKCVQTRKRNSHFTFPSFPSISLFFILNKNHTLC